MNLIEVLSINRLYNASIPNQVRNVLTNMCLDLNTMQLDAKLLVWPCHGEENQFFAFAQTGLNHLRLL